MVLYRAEDATSDSSSSSDNTLNDDEDGDFYDATQLQVTSLDDEYEDEIPTTFPFHLISGCSAAERATMCQYSQTVMSHEVRSSKKLGFEGTYVGWRCGGGVGTCPRWAGRWTLTDAPSSLPLLTRHPMQEHISRYPITYVFDEAR
jgi:hypothetical protein